MSADDMKGIFGFDRQLTRFDLLLGVTIAIGTLLITGTTYANTVSNRIANMEAQQAEAKKQIEEQRNELKALTRENQEQLKKIQIALARISEKVGVEVDQ